MSNNSGDAGKIQQYRQTLVDGLKKNGAIHTSQVEGAFRSVPRHIFLPGVPLEQVYSDQAIPVKRDAEGNWTSSSSQPAIMALMLEQLDLHSGQRVLEIGTGSGFNAALIASLVGPEGSVTTIDIQPDLTEKARQHLHAAGYDRVLAIPGDGGAGYAPGAPYDRMILTASSSLIPPAWREQLVEGGLLVLPLEIGAGIQKSVAFQRQGEALASISVIGAGFMPLQGAYAPPQSESVQLGPDPHLYLSGFQGLPADRETIHAWFEQPQDDRPVGIQATVQELLFNFFPWLMVQGAPWAQLNAIGELAGQDAFPALLHLGGERPSKRTLAIIDPQGLAALRRPPGQEAPMEDIYHFSPDFSTAFDLYARSYGPGRQAANRLGDFLHRWDQAGRPPSDRLHFRAIPEEQPYELQAGESLLERPWTHLIVWYA